MIGKERIDEFNTKMAERLGISLQKILTEKNIIDAGIGYNVFKEYIFRILSYYNSINFYDIYDKGKVDKIKEKEAEIEFEAFVMQPELWEQWKAGWDYKKPLHDKDWLKSVLKDEAKEFDEKDL